jgi:hypothetical protein
MLDAYRHVQEVSMLGNQYKKLFKPKIGHIFKIEAPYSEAEGNLRWLLRCKEHGDETHIAISKDLENPKKWQKVS